MLRPLMIPFVSVLLFSGVHKVVLKFDQEVDLPAVLFEYEVISWEGISGQPMYKASIDYSGSKRNLLRDLARLPNATHAEENQTGDLVGQEAAARIDQRPIMLLDDSIINQRPIMLLDEDLLGPHAPLYMQSFLYDVRAQDCWEYTQGAGITVAVLDTGIDLEHDFFDGSISPYGYDFVAEDSDPSDERIDLDENGNGLLDEGWGHGTHVAGIIKLMAPQVTILPIRVVNSDGQAELFDIIQGIHYAIISGAKVINMSMSIPDPSDLLDDWIDLAKYANVVVVTSAGNESRSSMDFPANKAGVLSVGSVDADFIRSGFSNYSRKLDLSAPGEMIYSCLPGGGYVARTGTSMSTPITSGAVALIAELTPGSNVTYFHGRLKNNAYSIDSFNPDYRGKIGKGLVDVWNAITLQDQPYPD